MSIIAATTTELKQQVKEAADSCNLSVSAFVKLAVTEKMNRMKKEKQEN